MLNKILDLSKAEFDEEQIDCHQYLYAKFKIDFGPWHRDHEAVCLTIDYLEGTITEYDCDNKIIVVCNLELHPTSYRKIDYDL